MHYHHPSSRKGPKARPDPARAQTVRRVGNWGICIACLARAEEVGYRGGRTGKMKVHLAMFMKTRESLGPFRDDLSGTGHLAVGASAPSDSVALQLLSN